MGTAVRLGVDEIVERLGGGATEDSEYGNFTPIFVFWKHPKEVTDIVYGVTSRNSGHRLLHIQKPRVLEEKFGQLKTSKVFDPVVVPL